MKISTKQAFAITLVPVAALLLSACSSSKQTTTSTAPSSQANGQTASQSAPAAASVQSAPAQATAQPQLQPLPADDKQAIDTEIGNINKDLKATDGTTKSTDLSNANLGL